MQHRLLVPSTLISMNHHVKKVVQRRAKRKNPKVANAIRRAHRVAIVVIRAIQAPVIRQAAAIRRHRRVNNFYFSDLIQITSTFINCIRLIAPSITLVHHKPQTTNNKTKKKFTIKKFHIH